LIEVVVAIGVLAVTVVAVVALQEANNRVVAGIAGQERAAQLVDASLIELARLRGRPVAGGQPSRLEALAALIPASDSIQPFKLVASRDGLRVISEDEADDAVTGVAPRDRYFLIEVRRQPSPLSYVADAGFLAVTLTVRWPYQIATGSGPANAVLTDLEQGSRVVFNAALAP